MTRNIARVALPLLLVATAAAEKPKVAVFPLGGDAPAEQREKVGFSLRAKLDRDGHFEPIDGPTMADLSAGKSFDRSTKPDALRPLVADESPAVLVWGELDNAGHGYTLKVNVLDLREKSPATRGRDPGGGRADGPAVRG